MAIPKEIKMGGHTLHIQIVDTSQLDNQGSYNDYHNLIRLQAETDVCPDNLAECLLHEILEAIKVKNNLEQDHTALTIISENLFQILQDNDLSCLYTNIP